LAFYKRCERTLLGNRSMNSVSKSSSHIFFHQKNERQPRLKELKYYIEHDTDDKQHASTSGCVRLRWPKIDVRPTTQKRSYAGKDSHVSKKRTSIRVVIRSRYPRSNASSHNGNCCESVQLRGTESGDHNTAHAASQYKIGSGTRRNTKQQRLLTKKE